MTSVTTILIISWPTMADMSISVDCQERILKDDQGNVVRCSAVDYLKKLKNPVGQFRSNGTKKDLTTRFAVESAKAMLE